MSATKPEHQPLHYDVWYNKRRYFLETFLSIWSSVYVYWFPTFYFEPAWYFQLIQSNNFISCTLLCFSIKWAWFCIVSAGDKAGSRIPRPSWAPGFCEQYSVSWGVPEHRSQTTVPQGEDLTCRDNWVHQNQIKYMNTWVNVCGILITSYAVSLYVKMLS